MSRLHLFEFEDQSWFPNVLRNYMTDFLQYLANITKMYKPVVPMLVEALRTSGHQTIVDLGSGGGGGLVWLNSELKKSIPDLKIILTDLYPNIAAFEHTEGKAQNFQFVGTPIDARDVPKTLVGLRTQFLSLHHFKEVDAVGILQNAVDAQAPIAIFEAQERGVSSIVAMLFSPITVFLLTPMIRPFKVGRILFTYLIPLVPLFVLWDGIVSALRTYSVLEMKALVRDVKGSEQYHWEVNRIKSGPGVILYMIGSKI
ncbi:hypothetical protein [Pseudochryseolinea flava]|uniref:Class I SAM-dependent methyltransferase n=1 Tax=Pseudochryseolinea flava TaxID=2059302 RepID=A0A364Y6P1_9BACT|nr:hypothetical protein [Pseudochryseolinea flava]RAW01885.1 hypothetical protein DQQ10_09600 [Pseudochryseolinea flava]